jgi:prepilin-type N-terminal cleavage/methylation domain-containing protein
MAKSTTGGFTLIEVLVATSMISVLMGIVAGILAISRSSLRIEGSEEINGRAIAVNPDDTVYAKACGLGIEFRSLLPLSRFVACADKPLTQDIAESHQTAPYVRLLTAEEARDPTAIRNEAEELGATFSSANGFTVWIVGADAQALATLTVERMEVKSSSGGSFFWYVTKLFGSYDSGFGLLYQYEFISPKDVAQPLVAPTYQNGVWHFGLPDPGCQSSTPNGSSVDQVETSMVYDAIARF